MKWEGEGEPPPKLGYRFLPRYGGWVKRKFITEPVSDTRNRLEIPRHEPLTVYMIQWLEELQQNDRVFPRYAKSGNPP